MLVAAAVQCILRVGGGGGGAEGGRARMIWHSDFKQVAYRTVRDSLLQLSHLLLAQLHIEGCNVLLQVPDTLGPRDGEDIIPLLLNPGQCQLPWLAPLLVCQHFDLFYQLLILHDNTQSSVIC